MEGLVSSKLSASELKDRGNSLVRSKDWAGAIECYSLALNSSGLDSQISAALYCNRALCHLKLENWISAVQDCSNALEIQPDYINARTRRAQARARMLHIHPAIKDYSFALKTLQDSSKKLPSHDFLLKHCSEELERLSAEYAKEFIRESNEVFTIRVDSTFSFEKAFQSCIEPDNPARFLHLLQSLNLDTTPRLVTTVLDESFLQALCRLLIEILDHIMHNFPKDRQDNVIDLISRFIKNLSKCRRFPIIYKFMPSEFKIAFRDKILASLPCINIQV